MSFTITGHVTDLDGDVRVGARARVSSRVSWVADGSTVLVGGADGTIGSDGTLTKDSGGPWVVDAPESTPLWLQVDGLPYVALDAPADGASVDLADLLAANVPRPLPSDSPLVKGDKGDTGRGVESITDTDLDGVATVTYDDGTIEALPLPRGQKGDKGDRGDVGPAQSITTSTPAAGLTRITWIGA